MSNLNDLSYVLELAGYALDHHRYSVTQHGHLYCPSCSDYRKMKVTDFTNVSSLLGVSIETYLSSTEACFVFKYTCLQCECKFTAFVYQGPNGPELAVFPAVNGGLSTQNTPVPVKYYLDQASRAQSAGANSAAIVMLRSALEHLLYEQGYVKGMLHQKITALENGTEVVPRPKWAVDLDTEYLKVMKELGNGAVHTNNGDVSLQRAFDSELIEKVKFIFRWLLDTVYEKPIRDTQNLQGLQKVISSFPKK